MKGDNGSVHISGKSAPQDYFKCNTCGFVAFGEDPAIAEETICLGCGNIMGARPAVKQTASSTGFNSRVLCNDGTCTGAIGADGRCKVCGKPHSSHEHNDASEKENFTKLTVSPSTGSLLESCNNCKHQFSIRASVCPKCNHERTSECFVCKKQIAKSSASCPECGDPSPFATEDTKEQKTNDTTSLTSEQNIEKKVGPYPWKPVLKWTLLIFVAGLFGVKPPKGIDGNLAIALKLIFALTYAVIGGVVIGTFKYFRR